LVAHDFSMGLPKTAAGFDGIVVTMDRLTKTLQARPAFSTITGDITQDSLLGHLVGRFAASGEGKSSRQPARFTLHCHCYVPQALQHVAKLHHDLA